MIKTYSTKLADIKRQWQVVDASDQVLGRLATRVAKILMGKHKAMFTRTLDTGDYVVVINAAKVRVTGNKASQKLYYRHSGYPGGFKSITLEKLMPADSTIVIEHAVKGMLPHNRMGAAMMKKLRVYAGDTHPHLAQTQPGPAKTRPAKPGPKRRRAPVEKPTPATATARATGRRKAPAKKPAPPAVAAKPKRRKAATEKPSPPARTGTRKPKTGKAAAEKPSPPAGTESGQASQGPPEETTSD